MARPMDRSDFAQEWIDTRAESDSRIVDCTQFKVVQHLVVGSTASCRG